MFKKLFGKKESKGIETKITPSQTGKVIVIGALDGNKTNLDLQLDPNMTNDDYIAVVNNMILYLSVEMTLRYNLNPQAYIQLLEKDLLNALANSKRTVEKDGK